MRRAAWLSVVTLFPLLALPACGDDDAAADEAGTGGDEPTYRATIRRTSYGIPHVIGEDLDNLAFGLGYAFAEDHLCTLADQIVKVRSERSKYFGADGGRNLDTDFAYLHVGVYQAALDEWDGLLDDVKGGIEGYAAGYNAYLADTGIDNLQPQCAGAAWVQPIDRYDLFAYYLDLGILASSRQLLTAVAVSQPPGQGQKVGPGIETTLGGERNADLGSNGWGIGRDLTENGRGMVFANPHFPWTGELRLWESQMTIPGELDVYGVGLLGVPAVLIGFNENLGWTHTVSAGQRFTFYELKLEPGDPTAYTYEGQTERMESTEYTVEVLEDDGSTRTESRTLWRSRYGPIINIDPLGWSAETAIAVRDANFPNTRLISQFLQMDKANSLDEYKAVFDEVGGIPWVNAMYADREGNAFYIDGSTTPNLSAEAEATWLEQRDGGNFLTLLAWDLAGVVLLDGSTDSAAWVDEPTSRGPGLQPYEDQPKVDRSDFVCNANDSHWLTNPAAPLEGFSVLHGAERTPRSLRTRMNLVALTEASAGGDDGKFSFEELKDAALSNRVLSAELLLDEVLATCQGVTMVADEDGTMRDVGAACTVLSSWDRRVNVDSVGAVVWREFIGDFGGDDLIDRGPLFDLGFSADDPVARPSGLADQTSGRAMLALANALSRLDRANIAVDAALGDVQYTLKGDERIPIHGANGREGVGNVVSYSGNNATLLPGIDRPPVINGATGLTEDGYVINFGTSFIMALGFEDDGPRAEAFLTYGQSSDPASPHFADQTRLFSDKAWRPILFKEADVLADPNLREYEVSGSAVSSDAGSGDTAE